MTNNPDYKIKLKEKIDEIAQALLDDIDNIDVSLSGGKPAAVGFYTGLPGKLLFLQQWHKLTPGAVLRPSVERCIDSLIAKMESGCQLLSYCNGAAGTIHYLRILESFSPGRVNLKKIEDLYLEQLRASALRQTSLGKYDYLHEGLGIANLYVDDEQYVANVLQALEQTGERTARGMRWRSKLSGDSGMGYNICFSHGISSIAAYLARVVRENPSQSNKQQALEMLRETTNYIMAQEIDFKRYGSFFPSTSLDNNDDWIGHSRMAWCYGDPGVLAGLWQAAKALGDGLLRTKIHGMMMRTRLRREGRNTVISEAAICHGSAGLAMIFSYYAQQTGNPAFKEAFDFWIDTTLNYAIHEDGLAGFKSRNHDDKRGYYWENNSTLLEGIAGIGLALMLALHDDKTLRKNLYNAFNLY